MFCSSCGKKRKLKYHDTMTESNLNCGKCKAWLGKIEMAPGRANPFYEWPIPAGTEPDPEVIKELGL